MFETRDEQREGSSGTFGLWFPRCPAITLWAFASADELHRRDAGAKPHTARRKARHHIAKVVNAQVHPAETDKEHQQC